MNPKFFVLPITVITIFVATTLCAMPTERRVLAQGDVAEILAGPWDAVHQRHLALLDIYGTSVTARSLTTSETVTRITGPDWFIVKRPGALVVNLRDMRFEGDCEKQADGSCAPEKLPRVDGPRAPAVSYNLDLLFRLPFVGRPAKGEIVRRDDDALTTFSMTDENGKMSGEFTFSHAGKFWSRRVIFADGKPLRTISTDGITSAAGIIVPERMNYDYAAETRKSSESTDKSSEPQKALRESFQIEDLIDVDYLYLQRRLRHLDAPTTDIVRPRA